MENQASRLLNPRAFLKNAKRSKLQSTRHRGSIGPLSPRLLFTFMLYSYTFHIAPSSYFCFPLFYNLDSDSLTC